MAEQEHSSQGDGEVLIQWEFSEFPDYQRKNGWYLWFGVIMAVLLGIGVFSDNYLFVAIILLFSVILFLQGWKKPKQIGFEITEAGIRIDGKEFLFRDIDRFWIVYEPPNVESLYFSFSSKLRPTLNIPLNGTNPVQVRETLTEFLPEELEEDEELFSDTISRWLKL